MGTGWAGEVRHGDLSLLAGSIAAVRGGGRGGDGAETSPNCALGTH